ncbi:MAG: M20 family peptidase [Chloroflexota bacterium]|nr:MAG: M20 family peptidase [Chloroflexota bacterium]
MAHTPHEQRVIEFVDDQRESLVQCAKDLIAAPSPNPPGDERLAAEVAKVNLARLGIDNIELHGPRPERANLVCSLDSGNPGPTLLLNGHLDTKPAIPLEAWLTDPYEPVEKDGRLIGLGAADMKGPDAALIYGLAAVRPVLTGLKGRVILALSADEEGAFIDGARYLVQELGLRADAALIAEPIGIRCAWEMIPLISRGISCIRFHILGTQVHSSLSDRLPVVNASLEAGRLLMFLEQNLKLCYPENSLCPGGPTINLGATLQSGSAYAMVAGEAEFTVDIRTLPGMTQRQLQEDIDRVVEEFHRQYPRAEVSWEFFEGTRAWSEPMQISPDLPIVRALQNAAGNVLGAVPPLGYFPGGTDAIWWQGAGGIPTIPGFGPGRLADCHQPNESILINEIIEAAKIYGLLILNYLQDLEE